MTQSETDAPVATQPKVTYEMLDEAAQKEMVKQSLLNLERLHLECGINMAINSPDINMTFEDGNTATLGARMDMLDDKLEKFKVAFKDLL